MKKFCSDYLELILEKNIYMKLANIETKLQELQYIVTHVKPVKEDYINNITKEFLRKI